ncbi:Uncharacterised protein [Streptococcus pneumoniae]|nr:Uncharacterised protein [Streptococcus pneumoniae]
MEGDARELRGGDTPLQVRERQQGGGAGRCAGRRPLGFALGPQGLRFPSHGQK